MKILVTDKVHSIFFSILEKHNFFLINKPDINYNELYNILPEYDGLIIRSNLIIDKDIISIAKKLKFIGRLGSGLDNIDIEFATKNNIICLNSPEGNRNSVAEQALGMLLSLMHNICKSNFELKNGYWNRYENSGVELDGKIIGIIGYGNTGSEFARKLLTFNVNILAYDKYKSGFSSFWVKETSLEDIQENADIISLHIPLNNETQNFVNENFINKCKKNFYLINTSRGKIVNTFDVYKALVSGKIIGVALDVIEFESTNFKNLSIVPDYLKEMINMPNVIITPHTAGLSDVSLYKMSKILAQKIINKFC